MLKGLPRRTVICRHVLRNSLLPTIAVVATQAGYLIGGLVVIETIFNYQGIGLALFRAATQKDFPVLQSGILMIGIVYLVATLIADILYSVLNPRVRLRGGRVSLRASPRPPARPRSATASPAVVGARSDDARVATKERLALLRRSKSFIAGAAIVGFWVLCALFGELLRPRTRWPSTRSTTCSRLRPTTGSAPTSSAATSSRASSSARATS